MTEFKETEKQHIREIWLDYHIYSGLGYVHKIWIGGEWYQLNMYGSYIFVN